MGIRYQASVILMVSILFSCSPSTDYQLAPIVTSGSIVDTVATRKSGNEKRRMSNQVNANLGAKSYIWQPWFLTVNGDVSVANTLDRGGDSSSDSLNTSGGLSLGFLPISKFPANLAYRHNDSTVSGDLVSSEFTQDRLSLNAQAAIATNTRATTGLVLDLIEQPEFGDEERREATLSLNTIFGSGALFGTDAINFDLRFADRDFESFIGPQHDTSEVNTLSSLEISSKPFEDVNVVSSTTYVTSDADGGSQSRERSSVQGISTARWQPKARPFTVNGAWRSLSESVETTDNQSAAGNGNTETQLHTGTIGLNYPIMPRLTSNAGLNGTFRDTKRESTTTTDSSENSGSSHSVGGNAGLNYQSLQTEVGSFDWRWNAGTLANFSIPSDQDNRFSETVRAGHSLTQAFALPYLGNVNFSGNQSAGVSHDNSDGAAANLGHRIGFTHNEFGEGVRSFIQLSMSDRRDLVARRKSESQLLQFLFNRQSSIDLTSRWQGDFSLQFTRQKTQGSDSNTLGNANGKVSYRSRDLFNVRNLGFRSELSVNSVGLGGVLTNDRDDGPRSEFFRSEWKNELEYLIGRLSLLLSASVYRDDENFGDSVSFRVRRDFGGP